jgi:hypothetical protein
MSTAKAPRGHAKLAKSRELWPLVVYAASFLFVFLLCGLHAQTRVFELAVGNCQSTALSVGRGAVDTSTNVYTAPCSDEGHDQVTITAVSKEQGSEDSDSIIVKFKAK